jgi:putative hydrolase of the HAD superfamily
MSTNKYRTLFFDLDHTLWDYNKSASETLTELYHHYNLADRVKFDASALIRAFFEINFKLWADYNVGKIDSAFLRKERFVLIFQALNEDVSLLPKNFGEEYIYQCPQKPHLIEGALDLLELLKGHYKMHVITNGFEDVQHTKLLSSGILHFFDEVITSERAGGKKPGQEIFAYSLKAAAEDKKYCLMIGDNIDTDILGARNFGMDQLYFNPEASLPPFTPSYEVKHLKDISSLLASH